MTTTFASLSLCQPVLRALTDEGYTVPTPIQAQAIPSIMEGRDMLGSAQTGTGKTAAFALPILHRLLTQPLDKSRKGSAIPRVLVLSPTRELASQIGESFATYGRHAGLHHTVVFGGVSQYHQVRAFHRGIDILVATPGRLIDLMEQGLTNFSAINTFVLDEADRMLDMGFIQPIRRIAAALPKTRQTLLFSATMPREIMHLADSLLTNPVKVAVAPVSSTTALIEQSLFMISRRQKQSLLHAIIDAEAIEKAVVFTKTKHGADKVAKRLNMAGISAAAIHGNKAQNQRTRTLDSFRSGRSRILVATDVAARGLDVDGITHVFNFDLPMEPEAYVHRIGRTGRAGATGIAISFCDSEERGLLRDVERVIGKKIPLVPTPPGLPEAEYIPEAEFQREFGGGRSGGGYGQRGFSGRGSGGRSDGYGSGGRGGSGRGGYSDRRPHSPSSDSGPRSDFKPSHTTGHTSGHTSGHAAGHKPAAAHPASHSSHTTGHTTGGAHKPAAHTATHAATSHAVPAHKPATHKPHAPKATDHPRSSGHPKHTSHAGAGHKPAHTGSSAGHGGKRSHTDGPSHSGKPSYSGKAGHSKPSYGSGKPSNSRSGGPRPGSGHKSGGHRGSR